MGGDAQVLACEGEARAEKGEGGGVAPQGAARAVLGLGRVRGPEAGRIGSSEGVVYCQLEGSGGGAAGVPGFACFAAQVVFLDFDCGFPEGVIAARRGFANCVGEGGAVEGLTGGTELEGILGAREVPFLCPLLEGAFAGTMLKSDEFALLLRLD